jgi:hypothetical protein
MHTTDLKQTASDAVSQSRSFISDQLDSRSTQIGETISSTAGDLRRIADELRSSETVAGGADLATRGADAIDKMGRYLQQADGDQLIADLEHFARQQPWAVAAAALTAGFAASRVLKASSSRRYRTAYGSPATTTASATNPYEH